MSRHHRQADARRQRDRARQQCFGVGETGTLQLDVIAAGKELRPIAREALGEGRLIREQGLADVAGRRRGQGNQAVSAVFSQPAAGDLRLRAVLVAQPGARQQLAEPAVPGARSAEQQHAMRLVPVGFVLHPAVRADDRLDTRGARRAVEFHHAEQVGRIGERERRHAVGRGPLHRLLDADNPVRHRVFAVHSQVNEVRRSHVKKFYRSASWNA